MTTVLGRPRMFTMTSGQRGTAAASVAAATNLPAHVALTIADALDAAVGGILAPVGITDPDTQVEILALLFALPEPRSGRS